MVAPWRLAGSLITLRDQVNTIWPNRSKVSDGSIGNAEHATRDSDHNPWINFNGMGIVSAIDITHDPANGADMQWLANRLVQYKDKRIKYVIWNGHIIKSYVDGSNRPAWVWQPYTGANPHNHHLHISVKPEPIYFDDMSSWNIPNNNISVEEIKNMRLFNIVGEDTVWGVSDDWMTKRHILDASELSQWKFLLGPKLGTVAPVPADSALWLRNIPVVNDVHASAATVTDADVDKIAARVIALLKGKL